MDCGRKVHVELVYFQSSVITFVSRVVTFKGHVFENWSNTALNFPG